MGGKAVFRDCFLQSKKKDRMKDLKKKGKIGELQNPFFAVLCRCLWDRTNLRLRHKIISAKNVLHFSNHWVQPSTTAVNLIHGLIQRTVHFTTNI